jgi:hypothetical protein
MALINIKINIIHIFYHNTCIDCIDKYNTRMMDDVHFGCHSNVNQYHPFVMDEIHSTKRALGESDYTTFKIVSKLSRFGLSGLWQLITPCSDLWSWWSLKQTCSSPWDFFNGVLHSACTHRGQVDSRLLMVGSQTASLTPGPSFAHNLCCKCPNGPCEAFSTFTLQDLSNGIKNTSRRGGLTPKIEF